MKPDKLRRTIVVISSVALILGSVFVWRFVQSKLSYRHLAEEATALRVRAQQGDAEAQFKLGSMYSKGKGVPTDLAEAVRWYRKSAEQGYTKAEYNLGYMYREGKGVPQDNAEAERWCRKAAEQGNARAQDGLGVMYYRGEWVAQDYQEAVRWYRKAAEQGYADAQYNLGYMYYYGLGVPQDRVEANRLFHQTAAQGSEQAKRIVASNRTSLCPPSARFVLALKFLASLFLGATFLKSKGSRSSRAQIVTGVAALLLVASFGLDVFWYFCANLLQSSMAVTALYVVRHLVGGLIVAVLASIVHPKSAKAVLIAAAVLFIAILLFPFVLFELRHVAPTIRLLSLVGLPIGMSIPPFIFRWLDTRRTRLNGDGGTTALAAVK